MDSILALKEIDIVAVLIGLYLILTAILVLFKLVEGLSVFIGKPVKWIKRKNEDHELIINTAKNLEKLQNKHEKDLARSLEHNEALKSDFKNFMLEIRDAISDTQSQIAQFAENRVHDREQSFQIQRELTDSIKSIDAGGKKREEQINAVMAGNRELLGAEIDRRFDRYIELKGIPSDELDEFISLHDAYKECKGNHNRDAKYDYIIENMPVLPVESKLKQKID